jgi:hypothetical protein
MKPPRRDKPPSPIIERVGEDGVVYVEKSARGNWEDKQRGRSIPHSGKILCGAWSLLIMWLSVWALVVSLVMKSLGHHDPWTVVCLGATGAFIVSLVLSLLISLTVKCPLCHGTPLHSRFGCRKHRLADHWPPLTYRTAVVLRILVSLSFRCIYCGTPFRLFKKSARLRS